MHSSSSSSTLRVRRKAADNSEVEKMHRPTVMSIISGCARKTGMVTIMWGLRCWRGGSWKRSQQATNDGSNWLVYFNGRRWRASVGQKSVWQFVTSVFSWERQCLLSSDEKQNNSFTGRSRILLMEVDRFVHSVRLLLLCECPLNSVTVVCIYSCRAPSAKCRARRYFNKNSNSRDLVLIIQANLLHRPCSVAHQSTELPGWIRASVHPRDSTFLEWALCIIRCRIVLYRIFGTSMRLCLLLRHLIQ